MAQAGVMQLQFEDKTLVYIVAGRYLNGLLKNSVKRAQQALAEAH